jgi:hypothetical protein
MTNYRNIPEQIELADNPLIMINRIKVVNLFTFLPKTDYSSINKRIWSTTRQSLLIESLIINLPIQHFILFENKFDHYQIIDGFQRFKAIDDFYNNRYQLTNLEVYKELNGKNYQQLPNKFKRILDSRTLHLLVSVNDAERTKLSNEQLRDILMARFH